MPKTARKQPTKRKAAPRKQAPKAKAPAPRTPSDPGDRVVAFVRKLITDAGPFILEPWAEQWLRKIFGTVDEHKRRRYTTAFLTIARRNGKTFLVAAVVLYLLLTEKNCRGLVAAAAVEQASEIFRYCRRMAELTPGLDELLRFTESKRLIECERTGVEFKIVASDADTQWGKSARFVIIDEVHAIKSGGHALVDALSTAQGAEDPGRLCVYITQAARAGDEHTAAGTLYALAKQVDAQPDLDPSFFPCIFEAPADCKIDDESAWLAANPSLGRIRKVEELREKCNRAKLSPVYESTFRLTYLNQWFTGSTTKANWLHELWPLGNQAVPDLTGETCIVGFDVAAKYDFCAAVALFHVGANYYVRPIFFLPEAVANEKAKKERGIPLRKWHDDGFLNLHPGAVLDPEQVLDEVVAEFRPYTVKRWAFDPYHDAAYLAGLERRGFTATTEVGQNVKNLSGPCKELEALLRGGRLIHGGHPLLWHQANGVALYHDRSGNMKPDRKASPISIDGLPALLVALAWDMLDAAPPTQSTTSVYETREMLFA